MAVVAFVASLIPLLILSPYNALQCILISVITGAVSSFTEMISRGGTDTVTVPLANAVVLWLLSLVVALP